MASRDEVERAIADLVRPLVVADGGTVDVVEVSDHEIVLRLSAACSGCPGATLTTSRVIEPVLRRVAGMAVRIRVETRS